MYNEPTLRHSKNPPFARIITDFLLIFSLFTILLLSHLAILGNSSSLDDKSAHRAGAFIAQFSNDELVKKLQNHLERSAELLDPISYNRYEDRFNFTGVYRFSNYLILQYEHLKILSPYQSVFLADFTLSSIALGIFLLCLKTTVRSHWRVFACALLISTFPFEADWFPANFKASGFSWTTSAPRGSALIFFLASIVISKADLNKTTRWSALIILSTFSFLSHSSTSLLLYIPAIGLLIANSGADVIERLRLKGLKLFLLFYIGTILLFATGKLLLLMFYQTVNISFDSNPIYIATLTGAVLYLWVFSLEQSNSSLHKLGNLISCCLFLFSGILVGTNLINFGDPYLRWGNTQIYILFEITNRLSGVVHSLFWILSGLYFYCKVFLAKSNLSRATWPAIFLIAVSATLPRFPYVTLFLVSLVLWVLAPQQSPKLKGASVLLLAIGAAMHIKITLLYVASTLAVFFTIEFFKRENKRVSTLALLLLYNTNWVVIGLVFAVNGYIVLNIGSLNFRTIVLILSSNMLIAFWQEFRSSIAWRGNVIARLTDRLFGLFIPISSTAFGLTLFPFLYPHEGFSYMIGEIGINLMHFSLVGFAILLCMFTLSTKADIRQFKRILALGVVSIVSFTYLNLILEIDFSEFRQQVFDKSLLSVQVSPLLNEPGIGAYENEVLYFQGVANELKLRNFPPN